MIVLALRYLLPSRTRVLVLIALLLVPIGLAGHVHVGAGPTHPCAACTLTQHAPIASTPALLTFVSRVAYDVVYDADPTVPVRRDQSPGAGRAPPPLSATLVA